MKPLLIASNNQGKIAEIKAIFSDLDLEVLSPQDLDLTDFDVKESGATFQDNALLKATAFATKTGLLTLADDSGLMVDALDGQPGVFSKRYGAGDHHRNLKLLKELRDVKHPHRTARFVSVVCLYDPDTKRHVCTQGSVAGQIALKISGREGFGYDPIFIPDEIPGDQTFGELGPSIKNTISHRARALQKLKTKLNR